MAGNDSPYEGFHVYGKGSAFKFEIIKNSKQVDVISFDAALKSGDSFDWELKTSFQITPVEHPAFLCCLLGLIPEFKAEFHGPKKDKSFRFATQVERQSMFAKVWEAGRPVGIEIEADKVFQLGALSMKVLSLQTGLDSATCLAVLRGTAARLYAGGGR